MSAKANPSNFALPGDEDEGENGDDDHEDSESDDDGAYSHKRASNQKYKPPKISAVPYNEDTGIPKWIFSFRITFKINVVTYFRAG